MNIDDHDINKPDQTGRLPDAPVEGGAAGAGTPRNTETATGTSPFSEPRAPWRQLPGNLQRGVRLALFLEVEPEEFFATPAALALLALCDLVLNFVVSLLLVGRGGSLAYSAVPGFLFHLPLLLFCGYLAGRQLSRPSMACLLPVALVSLSIPIELCHAVLERLVLIRKLQWLEPYLEAPHYYRFFWWWAAAALVFLLRIRAASLSRRLSAGLLLVVLVVAPLWFYPRADLWVSASENGGESGELQVDEKVLAAQAKLLDVQLAALSPGVRGQSHLYFVGFAGDATQDVFLKELLTAELLFTQRFGTAGRSVLLANNPRTGTKLPFASATNLEQTLTRLGQVMNRDGDVLVLFLTSHGSRDHELDVNNPPLELDQITPEMVRGMLQKSGIKWKVLIVSACYSGGFIDPLKDDRSLIITAADATSESFGCGFGEKYTWFGEAFLDQALRHSHSFTKAFESARETIRKWEQEQGETPSNPQIWVGEQMAKKLPALEKALAGKQKQKR